MFVQKLIFKQAQALKSKQALLSAATFRTFAFNARSLQTQDAIKVIDSLKSGQDVDNNCEVIDEYFRVNFRKIGFQQAWELLSHVSDVYELEDRFWVWETLEEAIRPQLVDVSDEQFDQIHKNFHKLHKGSKYFWNDIEDRLAGRVSIL